MHSALFVQHLHCALNDRLAVQLIGGFQTLVVQLVDYSR